MMLKSKYIIATYFITCLVMQSVSQHEISKYEYRWAFFHPFAAKKIQKHLNEAMNVYQSVKSSKLLDTVESGGTLDAFRHTYTMAYLSRFVKISKLRKLGKAHERGNEYFFYKNQQEFGERADSLACVMDLRNNELGFERFYYNDGFRNPNVLQNWSQTINNCIRIVNPFDNVFKSACIIQPEESEVQECVNFYTPWQSGDGEYTGFVYYVDPNRTVPTPPLSTENVDIYNGWRSAPGNGAQPQDFFNTYSGYQIPFEAWYAFTATKFITSPEERNSLVVRFSIVVYENISLTNEIYRVTQEKTYGYITELDDFVSVSTDVLRLSAGNIILVQTYINVDSVGFIIGNFKWLGGEFYYDTAKLSCVDLSNGTELTRPYLYKFDYNLCLSDYNLIRGNRRNALEIGGVKMWINRVERGFNKSCSMILSSNDLICVSNCEDEFRLPSYRIPNARLSGDWVEIEFAEEYIYEDSWGNINGYGFISLNDNSPPLYNLAYTLEKADLDNLATIVGSTYTIKGEDIALALYNKWLETVDIKKSLLVLNNRKLLVIFNSETEDIRLVTNKRSPNIIPSLIENFYEFKTLSSIIEDNYIEGAPSFSDIRIFKEDVNILLYVNINGVFIDVSSEIIDEVWERLNTTDTITDYYFYNLDTNTIVLTGLVEQF